MDTPESSTSAGALDRSVVVQTCRVLLRPIASLLLKCGMTWREFAEVSKGVFVTVASQDFGLHGRPTNVSRVSILTGVSRKEVGRVRALLEQASDPLPNKTTDATRVLSGWHQDPDFLTPEGAPRALPFDGEGPSFTTLWQRYGGDVPVTSMRKELERSGAITTLPDGTLRAERRYFMPRQFDPQWILNAGSMLRDLGSSITHNLDAGTAGAAGRRDGHARRFVGRATNSGVDPAALPEFRAFVEKNGQEFLERVDQWLTEHEARAAPDAADGQVRLGLGVFLIAGE
ncbi:MAG: hypothetical protein DYH20_05875 [Gammaproteobacteria bacterium PRO9]|nr:hypothetical protein [Gammaproteobacteria bacterium PRO9]